MNHNQIALYLCLVLLPSTLLAEESDQRPNIVLIMADDMGYTDIGCYGSEIKTPTLDRLAYNGVRFTQFYNTSRCCPTRAALLTGLYSHQAGIGLMTGDRGYDAYRGDLNRKCVTLAEVLGTAGYQNYMSGKWHVTKHVQHDGDNSNWPLQRGFDRFYGTIIGAGSFYDPATLCRGNTFITPENDPEYQPDSFYYSDAISDNAVRFIADHGRERADEPFFLYVAYTSAHWPMHAPEEDVKKYDGVYDEGFEPIRKARYKRAIELGVIDKEWAMSPGAQSWEATEHHEWEIRNMEVYAAMVDRTDRGIGRIVKQLEANEMLDNTIVIYLQDNGGCAEGFGRNDNSEQKKKFNYKPFGPNDLQTQIWTPMQTRDGRWVRTGPDAMAGAEDTFVAYGLGWANASNTPFRGYKHYGHEGGISTPFIVHWPNGIEENRRGKLFHEPSHLIDLMPTFAAVGNATYPSEFHEGEKIKPAEGVSLLPALAGKTLARSKPMGFEHHGNLALRDGKYKVVSTYRAKKPREWELFDMEADRTEQNDLSDKMPEKKQELIDKWQAWADRVGVVEHPVKRKK